MVCHRVDFKGTPEKGCQKSNAGPTGLLRKLLKDKNIWEMSTEVQCEQ